MAEDASWVGSGHRAGGRGPSGPRRGAQPRRRPARGGDLRPWRDGVRGGRSGRVRIGRAVATPLVVRSEIAYLKLARGDLRAEAVLTRPPGEVLAELEAGTRPEFAVEVDVTDGQGRSTSRMTVVWTLRPNRAEAPGPG